MAEGNLGRPNGVDVFGLLNWVIKSYSGRCERKEGKANRTQLWNNPRVHSLCQDRGLEAKEIEDASAREAARD